MTEERTITTEEINKIFLEKYGLCVKNIRTVQGGRSIIFQIDTDCGRYILKQCRKDISYETITTEIDVCRYLNERGISTSEFLSIQSIRGRYFTIQKYISGRIYDNNQVPEVVLYESGKILKDIRQILQDYPSNRVRWRPGWPFDYDYEQTLKELEIIKNNAIRERDEYSKQIINDVEYKTKLIREVKNTNLIDTNKLTYVNTHGDFSVRQLIVNAKHNKISVIDFEDFCKMPAVWEIIRSYSYASKECVNAIIDRSNFLEYLEKTELGMTLTDYDRSKIYHFYAVQLLLNTYGYQEYYGESTSYRTNYLKFGFWRTKLLQELMKTIEE